MPNDYISREAAISAIREAAIPCNEIFYAGVVSAFKAVNSVPAADVVPVVRGHWIANNICSVCKRSIIGYAVQQGYRGCPYCLARMDGGEYHAD